MNAVACEKSGVPVMDEAANNEYIYRRAYHELYEEHIERGERCYREREPLPEYFRKNDRVMVEESAHRYYQNCAVVSKMNEDEFVAGVLAEYDECKKGYDQNRIRVCLDVLSKIPTDLIKAYLSMKQNE